METKQASSLSQSGWKLQSAKTERMVRKWVKSTPLAKDRWRRLKSTIEFLGQGYGNSTPKQDSALSQKNYQSGIFDIDPKFPIDSSHSNLSEATRKMTGTARGLATKDQVVSVKGKLEARVRWTVEAVSASRWLGADGLRQWWKAIKATINESIRPCEDMKLIISFM
jgi:hypothetical protein